MRVSHGLRAHFDEPNLVSAAGLAVMKRLAGRPQDLLDLESLGVEVEDEDPSHEER